MPADFRAFAGGAVFSAGDAEREVWFTDGTASGTCRIQAGDLAPVGLVALADLVAPDTTVAPVPAFSNAAGMALAGTTDVLDAATVTIRLTAEGMAGHTVTAPVVGGRWAYNFASLAEAAWTASISATDLRGNTDQTPATVRFKMDRTPPETILAAAPTGLINQPSPVVTGTASLDAVKVTVTFGSLFRDPAGGNAPRSVEVPVVNGQWSATLPDLIGSARYDRGREFTWTAVATDAAGNTDPTPLAGGFLLDLTAPDTTVSVGDPTRATRGFIPVVVTNADNLAGGGITLTVLRPDGSTDVQEFGSAFFHIRLTEAPLDGTYTFTAVARDLAGNADATPAVTTLTVSRPAGWEVLFNDDFAPDTTIAVVPARVAGTTLRVSGGATDDPRFASGAETVLFRVESVTDAANPANRTIAVAVTDGAWQAAVDLGGFAHDEVVRFSAVAVARAGNEDRNSALGGTTRIDRVAPEASIASDGATPGLIRGATPGFQDATEIRLRLISPTGIETVTSVTPDNTCACEGVWSYAITDPLDGARTARIANAAEGTYAISARAIDGAGNDDSASPAQTITRVQRTAPETCRTRWAAAPATTRCTAMAATTCCRAAAGRTR